MKETTFYMGLQVSKNFELEKEFLLIDLYYESILFLVKDYEKKGYDKRNMGLLESINEYINDNNESIKETLKRYDISETKIW